MQMKPDSNKQKREERCFADTGWRGRQNVSTSVFPIPGRQSLVFLYGPSSCDAPGNALNRHGGPLEDRLVAEVEDHRAPCECHHPPSGCADAGPDRTHPRAPLRPSISRRRATDGFLRVAPARLLSPLPVRGFPGRQRLMPYASGSHPVVRFLRNTSPVRPGRESGDPLVNVASCRPVCRDDRSGLLLLRGWGRQGRIPF